MKVFFEKVDISGMIAVPAKFIDEYISKANGEYIKVYLYMLRNWDKDISFCGIADALDMLERDVSRAVSYWVKQGILSVVDKDGDESGGGNTDADNADVSFIYDRSADEQGFCELYPKSTESRDFVEDKGDKADKETLYQPAFSNSAVADKTYEKLPAKDDITMDKLEGNEDFRTLVYCTEKYLSKVLTSTDLQIIAYMYEGLAMPIELIEYLLELCISRNKRSLRYMESIAMDWHSKGIKSVAQARLAGEIYSAEVWSVLKAFGIRDRNPGIEELEYINKWFKEYNFSREIVLEACNRGLAKNTSNIFRYTDGILSSWHKLGVRSVSDIERADKEYKQKNIKIVDKKSHSAYNNFEQRNNDIDSIALEKLKLKLNKI